MKTHFKIMLSALALVGLQASSAHAQIVNGNMSVVTSGIPDGWTLTEAAVDSDTHLNGSHGDFTTPTPGGSGANWWGFGDTGAPSFPSTYDELSQAISTSGGSTYDVSFWVDAEPASYLRAYFGSTEGLHLDNVTSPVVASSGKYQWVEYSFTAVAAGPSTTLAFYGNNAPAWVGVADVSVTDLGSVGVPDVASTFGLLGAALVCLTGLRWKRA